MPVSTVSAATHIAPVVVKTFLEHRKKRKAREKEGHQSPQDDILFDEAFNIVKSFIDLGTKNTVESLQAFTNTRVPSPYWVAVSPVCIPLTTCNNAADLLIDWFGPGEIKSVVGGERWWQVRGLNGIDGEWIAEREDLDEEENMGNAENLTKDEQDIIRMEKLESVMFYVHGGGYFWGSINTHRYQLIRYTHKFRGRTFAANYRKAPQYPWPCPIHDVLAAYLYLIQPPPGAVHKPVDPKKIVFAGDSAGGGLCITVMTIIRDLGLPMPAGAALISPWVDLTHSFPSILQNTETDIIPAHGFLAKPSVVWPLELIPKTPRICPSETNPPPKPGKADTLKPTPERLNVAESRVDVPQGNYAVETQEQMLEKCSTPPITEYRKESSYTWEGNMGTEGASSSKARIIDDWKPKPPKVLMENSIETPLELRSQIQLYATTEQLTHPLVSPISQGSLGNLPPLYIIAGDGEMLRDEVIYLAHRAANPARYPVRNSVLREATRQRENAEKFTTPTKVHLQVFDGMCHVLTVFMFTESARHAYRSIAEFIKHVTQKSADEIERNPFPRVGHHSHSADDDKHEISGLKNKSRRSGKKKPKGEVQVENRDMYERITREEAEYRVRFTESLEPEGKQKDGISHSLMLRERIDIHGVARPLEPSEEIRCLQISPEQIGLIKEAPVMRWLRGQEEWDRRYRKVATRVLRKREKLTIKADRLIKHALEQGLVHEAHPVGDRSVKRKTSIGEIQADRRWGPLDLRDERPPASAIAARRDTHESLALLRQSIYHAAPVTHKTVPRLKASDNANAGPRQSVSEQQVERSSALNGLRIWENILGYLARKRRNVWGSGDRGNYSTV